MKVLAILILALFVTSGPIWATDVRSLGIVGDSASTGAIASQDFEASGSMIAGRGFYGIFQLLSPFSTPENYAVYSEYSDPEEFNIREPIWPPTRVWMAADEPNHLRKRTGGDRLQMMLLDTEEYSWGYLLGRKLGVLPKNIYIAARHGSVVKELEHQFAALQLRDSRQPNILPGHQPELVLVMMNLFDACNFHQDRTKDPEYRRQFLENYEREFREGFVAAFSNIVPNPKGTDIVLLSPVNLFQSFRRSDLLDRKVSFEHQDLTCRDLRTEGLPPLKWRGLKLFELSAMCKGILKIPWNDSERLDAVEALGHEMVEIQRRVTQKLAVQPPEGVRITIIDETELIHLDTEDFANDCWHPSLRGGEKIARTVHRLLEQRGVIGRRESGDGASPPK